MKKVLLVTSIFPPEIGGPATFIEQLAKELYRLGYKVTVVCNSTGEKYQSDDNYPFKVLRIFSRLWIIQIYKLIPILIWQMFWHDLVLVNGFEYSVYWASYIVRRPYVLKIVGDTAWEEARGSGLTSLSIDDFQNDKDVSSRVKRLRVWREKYLSGASQVIVPSEYLKKIVTGWNVSRDQINVIHNGILHSNHNNIVKHRIIKTSLKIVFIGRLTNWKGVETLLLALGKVDNAHAYIVGDGPEYPMLVGLSEQLGISSKVNFLGSLTHEMTMSLMQEMDVLVLGSSYEGLSHTLLEACSIGLPCIASSSGGNSEVIIHLDNGLLFPYGDVNTLSDLLILIRDDEDLRYRLACKAKESSYQFDFHQTVNNTIKALLQENA